ncbi:uncharacterized protein [Atheta coriaria]|uniref:uncharacterized protein isoform X3 n=1 Tax=Dalotia coriaria TaxID=877792 RepID=UPI0031F38EBA
MASPDNSCYVKFYSPKIPTFDDRTAYQEFHQYFQSLMQVKCTKLYLNYLESFGKIYYKDIEAVKLLIDKVKRNNIYSIKFDEIMPSDLKTPAGFNTVITEVMTDVNGKPVGLLKNNSSEMFISVSDAQRCGAILYSAEESQTALLDELRDFLKVHAAIYMKIRNVDQKIQNNVCIDVKFANMKSLTSPSPAGSIKSVSNSKNSHNGNNMNNNTPVKFNNSSSDKVTSAKSKTNPIMNGNTTNKKQGIKNPLTPRQLLLKLNKKPNGDSKPIQNTTTPETVSPKCIPRKSTPMKTKKLIDYPKGVVYVDKMNVNDEILVQVLRKTSETTYIGYIMINVTFDELLTQAKLKHELLTPSIGELVIVKLDDEKISRAYILELLDEGKFKVAALEYGQVVDVDAVFEVPDELLGYDEFLCVCEAPATFVANISVDDGLIQTVSGKNLLIDNDSKTLIKCTRWLPLSTASSKSEQIEVIEKVPQKIYTVPLPTTMPSVQINSKILFVAFNAGILYLRSRDLHMLITKMNEKLAQTGVDALEKPPIVGQYVFHKVDKEYRRSIVKKVSPHGFSIEHVDYFGMTTLIPTNSLNLLFNFSPVAIFGPTLIKARLRYFEDKDYSPNALQYITNCITKKFDVVYVQDDVVDLQTNSGCLSEVLLDLDAVKIKTIQDLPKMTAKLNEEFSMVVFHVADDGDIYFCPSTMNDSVALLEICAEIKHVQDLEDLVPGQLGIVWYEDEWTRVEALEVNGNKAKVRFIDAGKVTTFNVNQIKAIPDEMMNSPPLVLRGKLTQDSLHYGEYEDLEYTIFKAIIQNKQEDCYLIRLIRAVDED